MNASRSLQKLHRSLVFREENLFIASSKSPTTQKYSNFAVQNSALTGFWIELNSALSDGGAGWTAQCIPALSECLVERCGLSGDATSLDEYIEPNRPLVILSGSLSWPPLRGLMPLAVELYRQTKDFADFLLVYILEVCLVTNGTTSSIYTPSWPHWVGARCVCWWVSSICPGFISEDLLHTNLADSFENLCSFWDSFRKIVFVFSFRDSFCFGLGIIFSNFTLLPVFCKFWLLFPNLTSVFQFHTFFQILCILLFLMRLFWSHHVCLVPWFHLWSDRVCVLIACLNLCSRVFWMCVLIRVRLYSDQVLLSSRACNWSRAFCRVCSDSLCSLIACMFWSCVLWVCSSRIYFLCLRMFRLTLMMNGPYQTIDIPLTEEMFTLNSLQL